MEKHELAKEATKVLVLTETYFDALGIKIQVDEDDGSLEFVGPSKEPSEIDLVELRKIADVLATKVIRISQWLEDKTGPENNET